MRYRGFATAAAQTLMIRPSSFAMEFTIDSPPEAGSLSTQLRASRALGLTKARCYPGVP